MPTIDLSQANLESCVLRMELTEKSLLNCLRQCLPTMGTEVKENCIERMCVAVIRTFLAGVPFLKNSNKKVLQDALTLRVLSNRYNTYMYAHSL